MNKKKYTIGIALILFLSIGAIVMIGNKASSPNASNNEPENTSLASPQQSSDVAQMANEQDSQDQNLPTSRSYISLSDYQANPELFESANKVYFFHASWCPICQSIDKELQNDPTKVPNGVTIIKTDFDKFTDLRQKYGVTTQYTFVQVDANDAQVAKWTATSADKAIAGIKVN
jgi:thiol-disulfide isomerase/thioredoxin